GGVGFIGRIEAIGGSSQSQATRAGSHFVHIGWRQRSSGAIHSEQINAAAISGRQIHLSRRHIVERGAESADVSHERGLGGGGLRPDGSEQERAASGEYGRGFQKRATGDMRRG